MMKKIASTLIIVLLGLGLHAQNNPLLPATYPGNQASQGSVVNTSLNSYLNGHSLSVGGTIDQDQPLINSSMASFGQLGLAQSFIPTANDISGAGIAVYYLSGSIVADITIELWDNLPNAGGNLLTTGTVNGTFNATTVFADVFWPAYPVTPGTTYYLVFRSSQSSIYINGNVSDPYPFGCVYANTYSQFATYDYTFHTYTGGGMAVPIGNWVIVLSMLLIGTSIIIRYKRRVA